MLKCHLTLKHSMGCAGLLVLMLVPSLGLAQIGTATATINGTVSDASGAVIPGATVTATNTNTGIQVSTHSNDDGSYVLPALPVGPYTLSVDKPGFAAYTETGITLHPTIVTTVSPVMKPSGTVSHVTVVASANQVQTSTDEVSSSVSGQEAFNLPINGRFFESLEAIMPGVTNTQPDTARTQSVFAQNNVLSVNGMGTRGTMYYTDGIWNMNSGDMSQVTVAPSADAIEEIRSLQNNYSVQYSLMGANAMLVQTKSGTDTFHGTVYEYVRNTDFNARNYFSSVVPAVKQNDFGFTLGGPLYVPGHRSKDPKTFFFFSQEWSLQDSASTLLGDSPTAANRQGTFTSAITNPATGQPYPQSSPGVYQIPSNMLNQSSVLLMNSLVPLPNNPSGGFQNYINLVPAYIKTRDDEAKIDHNFSPRVRLVAEYFDQRSINNNPNDTFDGSPFDTMTNPIKTDDQLAQIQLTTTLSSSMVNTASVAMNYVRLDIGSAGLWLTSQIPGFTENLPYGNAVGSNRLPQMTFSQGYTTFGGDPQIPQNHADCLENTFSDDWSWLHGKHYVQAGINMVFGNEKQPNYQPTNGVWSFSGQFTGNAIADYLIGESATFTQASTVPNPYTFYKIVSPYVQDRWKVTRRLTVTAGIRLLHLPVDHAPPGYDSSFDPQLYNAAQAPIVNNNGTISPTANYNPLNGVVLNGVNGVPINFVSGHDWYAAPSVGFAYDVFGDGRTSVRGGYGIGYDRSPQGSTCSYYCSGNIPRVSTLTLVTPSFPNPVGAAPAPPSAPTFAKNSSFNLEPTQVQTYSLSVEHDFGHNWFASIATAGNVVRHLVSRTENINQPLPDAPYDYNPNINTGSVFTYVYAPYQGYAAINTYISNLNAYWNALEISVRHALGHNLFLNAGYTYQHALSEAPGANGALLGTGIQNTYNLSGNYGNTPTSVTHVFSLGYIWGLPYQNHQGLKGLALGDWKYAGTTFIQTGLPLNPGLSASHAGLATQSSRIANSVAGPQTVADWFNTGAFAQPAAGYFGNAAPYSIPGPGMTDFDMALYKDFHLTERYFFQFRGEFFNAFNHANFSGVSTNFGAKNFGHITSAYDPRIVELSLRFQF